MNLHPRTMRNIENAAAFTIHRQPDGLYWIEAHRLNTHATRLPGYRRDGGIHRDSRTNRTYRVHETGHGKHRKITLTPDGYYDGEPLCTADGERLTFDTKRSALRFIEQCPDTRPLWRPIENDPETYRRFLANNAKRDTRKPAGPDNIRGKGN